MAEERGCPGKRVITEERKAWLGLVDYSTSLAYPFFSLVPVPFSALALSRR
jgi:hypothetical protein